eukprot:symbB.v1.2.021029.t1/scaffold1798.1/size163522/8
MDISDIFQASRRDRRIQKPRAGVGQVWGLGKALKNPFEAAIRIKGLADQLRLNKILTNVDMAHQNICDEKLKALADAFRVNKTVTKVNLCYNEFGDDGLKALASAMEVNETITEVKLNYMDKGQLAMLSDEGRQAREDIKRLCSRNKERTLQPAV